MTHNDRGEVNLQWIIVGETDILEGVADGSEAGWNSSWPAINQAVQEPGPELRLDKMGLLGREGRGPRRPRLPVFLGLTNVVVTI